MPRNQPFRTRKTEVIEQLLTFMTSSYPVVALNMYKVTLAAKIVLRIWLLKRLSN